MFYKSFERLYDLDYRDVLLIETDTRPVISNWIDKIIDYCDSTKFLISGSMYRGNLEIPDYETWSGHLNGVAIYRNSEFLKTFLEQTKLVSSRYITKRINNFLAFDVAMHINYCTYFGRKNCQNRFKPENHLLDCPIISNYSMSSDKDTKLETILQEYPETIILHQK